MDLVAKVLEIIVYLLTIAVLIRELKKKKPRNRRKSVKQKR